MVVLDNVTGGVRAMVGGYDYQEQPFNLATQGQRQPGSVLQAVHAGDRARAGHLARHGLFLAAEGAPLQAPGVKAPQLFEVHNYDDSYLGSASIATATTYSDNSVYPLGAGGLQGRPPRTSPRRPTRWAIETPISTNPAMILGGLEQGVTPLDMAHAFQTLATTASG